MYLMSFVLEFTEWLSPCPSVVFWATWNLFHGIRGAKWYRVGVCCSIQVEMGGKKPIHSVMHSPLYKLLFSLWKSSHTKKGKFLLIFSKKPSIHTSFYAVPMNFPVLKISFTGGPEKAEKEGENMPPCKLFHS